MSDSLQPHGLWLARLLCHGILQARILEWVAIPFFRGSSQPRDRIQVSCIAGTFFTIWATREVYKQKFCAKCLPVQDSCENTLGAGKPLTPFLELGSWTGRWVSHWAEGEGGSGVTPHIGGWWTTSQTGALRRRSRLATKGNALPGKAGRNLPPFYIISFYKGNVFIIRSLENNKSLQFHYSNKVVLHFIIILVFLCMYIFLNSKCSIVLL